jgi:nicotinate-nucleotide pyrophosphorylase (carboxylating)
VTIEPALPGAVLDAVARALAEDRAAEDVTTLATVRPDLIGTARLLAKEAGVLAGIDVATEALHQVERRTVCNARLKDGEAFVEGSVIAEFTGPVRGLLQAERVALNFVQRLSGVATLTRAYVEAAKGTRAVILDTRKTTPGLRDMEKYAVRCGGGTNHRRDLASMAMIKDNHREALARDGVSLSDGVAAIRRTSPGIPVEVEIDALDQLDAALASQPDWVLLDNMSTVDMAEAVRRTAGRVKLEASGGVTLATVRAIAETGVDAISVGALTHSAPALDLSLELTF